VIVITVSYGYQEKAPRPDPSVRGSMSESSEIHTPSQGTT